ncbi:MAG: hypothetical protein ABJO02_05585 [Reichenbachiella sp.]|uniref:hypothetical protein n=1 Tax=Reichenbachiella sp. TaxID=2184521 RepID=UPI0032971C4D
MRYYYLILSVFLFACHEQNKNKISPAELMKSREIRKVSEAEILKKGEIIGREILESVIKLSTQKVNDTSTLCDEKDWKELDALVKMNQAKVQRINSKSENLTELELQLLEAYQYNLEQNMKPTGSIQKLDAKTALYAYPVDSNSNIYKYCMDSISRKSAELWTIKIPIKEIINKL